MSGPRIKDITFEDGTASLVNATTGAGLNANNGMVQESVSPIKGLYSARSPNTNNTYLDQSFTAVNNVYTSFYIRVASLPPADMRIAQILGSGNTIANLWLRTNGTLCLKYGAYWSGGTTTTACSAPIQLAPTYYRVGLHQLRGDGTNNAVVEAFLAQGDAQFSTPFASSTVTPTAAGYWQYQANDLRIGPSLTSSSLDATFDDIKLDTAFMPGPSAGTGAPAARGADGVGCDADRAGFDAAGLGRQCDGGNQLCGGAECNK